MILKTCFLLVVSVAWEISGASYSTVYVQNGPAATSEEYITHGGTPYNYGYPTPQRAQYNVAPVSYEYPIAQSYSYRTACPMDACVYPEQTIAAIAPATSAANYLTYNAPALSNLPYVYGRNEPSSSYSYVLINQGAAGQNLKLSDGEVIRRGYTFLQPEGLVQYVAEDKQGLNAIFKSNIPNDAVANTETVHQKSVLHTEPCIEAKSEVLPAHESVDEEHKASPYTQEARHGGHEEPEVRENVLHDDSESGNHEHIIVIEAQEKHHEEPEEHHEPKPEEHEHHEEEQAEPIHESQLTHGSIVEITHEPHENHEYHEGHVAPQVPALAGNNLYIPYNDFIKCIQAAMARGITYPYYTGVLKPTSPLAYLVFNKPC